MSEKCNTILGVLQRNGTDQSLRNRAALNPDSIELHGFDISEWMQFAYDFAQRVNFFNESSSTVPSNDWQSFFERFQEGDSFLEELENTNELTPHLTLFICFLKLMDLPKQRLNKITKRHLDFFYEEVLHIEKLPETSDSVYALFELAKNLDQEKLEVGLQLDGGKDADGKQLIYELDEELVVNQTKVAELKSVYMHNGVTTVQNSDANYYFRTSEVANSYDGKGEPFPGEDQSWLPFGYYQNRFGQLPQMEKGKIGFSISSHALFLSEGKRFAQFSFEFKNVLSAYTFAELNSAVEVYYTAKNNWVGPLELHYSATASELLTPFSDQKIEREEDFSSFVSSNYMKLCAKLEPKDKPTASFDEEIHGGRYDTTNPIFKFIIDANTDVGQRLQTDLSKEMYGVNIHIGVSGMKQLVLDSDTGTLNPTKPMFPFTQNPVKGSSMIVDHEEIFSKKWSTISAKIKWRNTPYDFNVWYSAYQKGATSGLSHVSYLSSQETVVPDDHTSEYQQMNLPGNNSIVTSDAYFKANKYIKYNEEWKSDPGEVTLFVNPQFTGVAATEDDDVNFECSFSVTNFSPSSTDVGPLKLSLVTPFMHQTYPQLYAIALTSESPTAIIPNPPYTPFTDEITLTYFAKESATFRNNSEETYEDRTVTLFHEHPFGQSKEHDYLRVKFDAKNKFCTLIPKYEKGGQLFIGLKDAEVLQTISLLIQVQEGSENPLAETFSVENPVKWEVLDNDHWKELSSLNILKNEVDNFLKSGIVSIKIPRNASNNNTQLEGGLFWIKATMNKSFDAVCRVMNIQAQGARATFKNNENDLAHLEKGLPAETISKLVSRFAKIKQVTQPYNSFNGKQEENDELYYKRVSERLRHKNRAVMLWDYENIILQEFPDIYKVKCLNHTSTNSFMAAGCVTLVVIPDTVGKNMFNIYQPRVSTARLNEVQSHISELTSLHVHTSVINPKYEEIEISVDVRFYNQFDESLYKIQLDTDLKRFLSPWAFDDRAHVEFGITLHRSVLIDFIEKLHYVDYVSNIQMKIDGGEFVKNCTPSSPKAILVSAEQHNISISETKCSIADLTIQEEC